jgi:Fe2+ or Zn2+ uptake regulation protein
MPLTKRQFELRIDEEMEDWMRQVYHLLNNHRDLAYSSEELCQAVLGKSRDLSASEKLHRSLDALARIGAVERREVHETAYYAFSMAFDTQTWTPN